MKQPRPNKIVPKEDVTVSTDTLNFSESKTYPALARGDRAPSRLAAKHLRIIGVQLIWMPRMGHTMSKNRPLSSSVANLT